MCDICVRQRWYVCNECAAEFIKKNPGEITDVGERFAAFMETEKSPFPDEVPATAEDFLDQYRRSKDTP
jgi:hypothetical protein